MENGKIKVLILEDDSSLASSLQEALSRVGAEVLVAHKPDQALAFLNEHTIGIAYVDLMLPQMSGQEFVTKLRASPHGLRMPVVLMSGIFTDNQSINEAKAATGAVGFLKKPFSLAEATQPFEALERGKKGIEKSPRKKLYSLIGSRDKVSTRARIKLIQGLEEVHGYDLPMIMAVLIEAGATGHLNIVDEKNQISGITLHEGHIVGVDVADKETYLGHILIAGGYLTAADLEQGLKIKNDKKIGQKLIQESLLSPHAFEWALEEQLTIRLSQVLVPGNIQVNFVSSEVNHDGPAIRSSEFTNFLHDWIASKIPSDWLRIHYRPWFENKVCKGVNWTEQNDIVKWPLFASHPELCDLFASGQTLDEIVEKSKIEEKLVLKAFHLAFIKGIYNFDDTKGQESESNRIDKLSAFLKQTVGKNPIEVFELMGGRPTSKRAEKDVAWNEFLEFIGQAPAPNSLNDLKKNYQDVLTLVTNAYNVVTDDKQREKIMAEASTREVAEKVRAQGQFDEAKTLMTKGQNLPALQILKAIHTTHPDFFQLCLYMSWAGLMTAERSKDKAKMLKDIDLDMMQVPAEEKTSALYFFVSGYYAKIQGDLVKAKKLFMQAAQIDPRMVEAKRELNVISLQSKSRKADTSDIGALVSSWFKKSS